MGDAVIYYTPTPGKGIEVITLTGGLSGWTPDPQQDGERTRSKAGATYCVYSSAWERFHIRYERFTDRALYAKLYAFQRHLQMGGTCGVAMDSAKAWAGFVTNNVVRGQTLLHTAGDQFWAGYAAAALAAADDVVLVSTLPEARMEKHALSAVSGNTLTLASGGLDSDMLGPVLVRQAEYCPLGALPEDHDGHVLHDVDGKNIRWTLDLTLDAAVDKMAYQAGHPGLSFDTGSTGTGGKVDPWSSTRGGGAGPIKGGSGGLLGNVPGKRR